MRSLQDRYEVTYDWPSLMAMILGAEATSHAKQSSPQHPCRLSTNITTEAASNAVTMITYGLGLMSCPQGTGAHKLDEIYMFSMTGYRNACELDIRMQWLLAMAMVMMSSEGPPPSKLPSDDEAYTVIADFTEITVSDSDNDLHWVQAPRAKLMFGCLIFPNASTDNGVALDVPSFCSLLFTCLDLGPVQMASAWVFTTCRDMSSGGGISLCTGSAEWLPYGSNRFFDLWVHTITKVEQLFDSFPSYSCMDLFSPGGLHLERAIK